MNNTFYVDVHEGSSIMQPGVQYFGYAMFQALSPTQAVIKSRKSDQDKWIITSD